MVEFSSEPKPSTDWDKFRDKLDQGFKELAELISDSRRPLPTQTGDGTYLKYPDDDPNLLKKIESTISDLSHLGIPDVATLLTVQDKNKTGALWNDKEYLMERLIQTATKFPDNSPMGATVTNGFLTALYNDLQHPPTSYLGTEYQYRSADGSFNSLLHPHVGKANTPYARTVAPKTMQPGALPAAGDIFDSIMTRKHRVPHPNKISSMLFYIASIIIHDLFRTDHKNVTNSLTSSYLDLAPLYGSNQEEQNRMRTFEDGKLKPDAFSEVRLLSFPPGVGMLLVLFNRFHNDTVETLAKINQGDIFTRPTGDWPAIDPLDPKYPADWKKYDNDLFQTGRLITSGLYINIILLDYVRTILNLNKTNSDWHLDPRADIRGTPVAAGNQVSAEFNLVYRWHSAISVRDEEWTDAFWKENFSKLSPDDDNPVDFLIAAGTMQAKQTAMDPGERPLGKMQRGPDGKFKDEDLVKELVASISDCANSYGANRVPSVMRIVEILGIQQARAWNVASLNEFRKYFALEPHKTFESINPDPYVAAQLKNLYDHPDYVELYPGLVCEEAKKPMVPAAGLTPGFTISRAVLSDAVALVRGDRFYTIDYHPKKLTNWGFTQSGTDITINNGCVLYKLILNAFPFHFAQNSIYAHFPLTVPEEMTRVLKDLGKDHIFDTAVPKLRKPVKVISSYDVVKQVLADSANFQNTLDASAIKILGEYGKKHVTGDIPKSAKELVDDCLYPEGELEQTIKTYYESITSRLLKEKAYKLGKKNQVDIVRDIGNLAHVHFVAEMFSLPLKSKDHEHGLFTERELYVIMAGIWLQVYFDASPINSFDLRYKSNTAASILGKIVETNVSSVVEGGVFSKAVSAIFHGKESPLQKFGTALMKDWSKAGFNIQQLVWGHILGTMGGMTASHGQLFAQVLEFYLTTGKENWGEIAKLANDSSPKAYDTLRKYILEGLRIAGEPGVYRECIKETKITDGPNTITLLPGDKVLINLHAASLDEKAFPSPFKVDISRPEATYAALGLGPHRNLGITVTALTSMFKVIGKLPGLAAVNGPQGVLHKISAPYVVYGEKPNAPWYHLYLTENHDRLWPLPSAMRVNWN